jgi:hypothetical protein
VGSPNYLTGAFERVEDNPMVNKFKKEGCSTIWQVGPWFISINHKTRKVQQTSGDYWFPITRQEAVKFFKHERSLQRAA